MARKIHAIKAASLTLWDETTYIIALILFTANAVQTSSFYLVLSDCSDLFKSGHTQSGVYSVNQTVKDPSMYIVTCALMVEDGPCFREDKMARWTSIAAGMITNQALVS